MNSDEQEIRQLVAAWMAATRKGWNQLAIICPYMV